MTKQQAIKEIEKLTGSRLVGMVYDYPHNYAFESNGNYLIITTNCNFMYRNVNYEDLFINYNWLEPLSRLIPILFKEGE